MLSGTHTQTVGSCISRTRHPNKGEDVYGTVQYRCTLVIILACVGEASVPRASASWLCADALRRAFSVSRLRRTPHIFISYTVYSTCKLYVRAHVHVVSASPARLSVCCFCLFHHLFHSETERPQVQNQSPNPAMATECVQPAFPHSSTQQQPRKCVCLSRLCFT